jgi:hypothetical protein
MVIGFCGRTRTRVNFYHAIGAKAKSNVELVQRAVIAKDNRSVDTPVERHKHKRDHNKYAKKQKSSEVSGVSGIKK